MTRIGTIAHTVWLEMLRKKDLYVLLILLGALLATLVSLDIFGLGGVVRYVKDVGYLTAWVFAWILAVGISTQQLTTEETRGTIFPLLAKPVNRLEVIVGKWLGTWTITCAATGCFYVLVTLIVAAKGGATHGATILQGYILHCTALAMITATGILFSTRLNRDAAATMTYVATGAVFLIVPRVPVLLAHTRGFSATALLVLYNLMPHFEVFDLRKRIVHDYGPTGSLLCLLLVGYGLLWTAMLLLASWLAYRRKRFTRETQV
jgi:ABC-type transport system involved in multi-copper enzyme maturation permease subunit